MSVLRQIKKKNLRIKNDYPALIYTGKILSYNELQREIRFTSAYLYNLGIRENCKVAILGNNSRDYVICLFSLWELNACTIPLNTKLTDNEISELLKFADTDFLLVNVNEERELSSKIPQIIFPFNVPDQEINFEPPGINPENVSLIMFTSGVTGKPKGVMHTINDLLNSADNAQDFLSQDENDRWLASLPFFHIGGLSIIIRSFRFGSTLIIPDSLKNDDLKNAFDIFKPSFASLVPTQLKRLLDTKWKPGKELKCLLLGGGSLNEKLVKIAIAAGCKISNVYGSTETSAFVTANYGENLKKKPLSAGKPLGKNKISMLVSNTFNEIRVESNALFHGYYKDEENTELKLKDGKFLTGDVGFLDEDGDLFIEARRTDLIITGGENVNPVEVENILNTVPGIKESCVFALEDQEWGQIVAAAVVLNKKISIMEIGDYLKGKLASYKIPKRFFTVDEIPKTSIGKIMREKTRGMLNDE